MNIQQMMQKAQVMQKKMEELQEQMGHMEVGGTAGAGMVKVVMTCKGIMRKVEIDPSLIKVEDKDILEDLIKAAINDARSKADETMANETQKAMGGMGLPAGLKLPF
jgi:DNA-binding YbaB/EbfC family protein